MPKITVTVDDETYARLQNEALDQDRTVTAQVRRILRSWHPVEDKQLKIPDDLMPKIRAPESGPPPWRPYNQGVTWTPGGAPTSTSEPEPEGLQ